ncbi:LuxR C-terminal-related transcriptional regulator [Ktedonobacter racemifer]|uniref:ATP-dependent transcriptional regulator, MalT-like, LuxR family n=1 Tax=Ktedonobacter racemifer DSM 44963 TaxID=485913 RepID=D6TTV7_KTERA|nr:LuxR C-terminal-related transcriptional regulator [Ktedonobacter racemifer]EFH83858.1 ATP-dependent transcriptional regulator, MalT-like, LuxR family [Ktedonobacter racemifer DSM 44963]
MPRRASYHVLWSPEEGAYVLRDAGGQQVPLAGEESWSKGLAELASFAFTSRLGPHCTVRREKMQRGDSYWYAYRSLNGRTSKRYIGRHAELTPARLEQVAEFFPQVAMPKTGVENSPQINVPISQTSSASVSTVSSLLDSRLQPPRLPAFPVERSRLFSLLDAGWGEKVTLVCAPAGFGKSILVRQWLNARHAQTPIAWLSLEDGDNDPVRFWRYMIMACQRLAPGLGTESLALLSATPPSPFATPSFEAFVTTLLNELVQLTEESLLVLDDYQVITEARIHTTLTSFIEHLPSTVHILLLSRSAPPLPLTRWRARGELSNLYTNDLRFSREEMADFLRQALPYACSVEALHHLEKHLEGWVAGLRLLSLAVRGKRTPQEVEQYILHLTGEQRSFQDYFVQEILASQPEPLQSLLLSTSILSRVSGSLCAALTEREESAELLEALARAGLFLEELEGGKDERWYRYYPLFAEAMQAEARTRLGEEALRDLARKASLWFEQHQMSIEAVEAALRAHDITRSADLIEQLVESIHPQRPGEYFIVNEFHTLCRWLAQLPEDMLSKHPMLCFSYANALLYTFVLDEIPLTEEKGRLLMKSLDMAQEGWQREGNMPRLGEVLSYRAILARQYGAINEAIELAQEALTYLPEDSPMWRPISLSVIGTHLYLSGQLNVARDFFQPRPTQAVPPPRRSFTRPGIIIYSRICREQVALHQARAHLRPLLAQAREDEDRDDISDALLELARLSYAWNRLDEAEQQVQDALVLAKQIQVEETIVYASLLLVDIWQARGDNGGVLQLLSELQAGIQPGLTPLHTQLYRQVQAVQAHLHLVVGDLVAVERWLKDREQNEEPFPPLFAEKEVLLITRYELMQGQYEEVLSRLAALSLQAQGAGRIDRALKMKLLMARAHAGLRQAREARRLVQEVVLQAAPENYLRLFLDEGEELVPLLRSLLPELQGETPLRFTRELLQMLTWGNSAATSLELSEALSSQEARVLRLLVAGRSNPEIANELVVSINTVKTQLQNIYRKLNVSNRVEASEAARQLKLV